MTDFQSFLNEGTNQQERKKFRFFFFSYEQTNEQTNERYTLCKFLHSRTLSAPATTVHYVFTQITEYVVTHNILLLS